MPAIQEKQTRKKFLEQKKTAKHNTCVGIYSRRCRRFMRQISRVSRLNSSRKLSGTAVREKNNPLKLFFTTIVFHYISQLNVCSWLLSIDTQSILAVGWQIGFEISKTDQFGLSRYLSWAEIGQRWVVLFNYSIFIIYLPNVIYVIKAFN